MTETVATEFWKPDVGDDVYWNHPDMGRVGTVRRYVDAADQMPFRVGQPVIEADDGRHVVIHPHFLLPFEFGGPEWRAARDEGRIGG